MLSPPLASGQNPSLARCECLHSALAPTVNIGIFAFGLFGLGSFVCCSKKFDDKIAIEGGR